MNVLSWYILGFAIGIAGNFLLQYMGLEPTQTPVVTGISTGCILAFWRLSIDSDS